ncbi:MAG TPA: hypothetical protein VFT42_08155 [Solirubrobacteraceae bacterium]|nr:hypothetical protein [Solirubrobacteraceae bacterium]
MWRRALLLFAVVVAALVIASEIFLPGIAARRIEHRLAADGGTATVSVTAQPALRLLFGDGQKLVVRGEGDTLHLPSLGAAPRDDALGRLDGFGQVQLHLRDLHAAPFQVRSVDLVRRKGSPLYELRLDATASATGLGQYVAGTLGSLGAALLAPSATLPVTGAFALRSDHGRAQLVSGDATVAGIPVGPLGAAVLVAIVDRL